MPLEDLTSNTQQPTPKRSLAWLLPAGLVLGFCLILALLFGERLLPAKAVDVAPVITVRTGENEVSQGDASTGDSSPGTGRGEMLFQASGWAEPAPYITYISTLINGVIDEVHALEGEAIHKGQLIATLIDDDATLDLRAAENRYETLTKQIVAHCAGFEITAAEKNAAERRIDALETLLEEAADNFDRLDGLEEGTVSQQQVVQARLLLERQKAKLAEARAELPKLDAEVAQLESEKDAMDARLEELATLRDRAALQLERTKIISPIDGVVLHLHAAPGKKRMLNMDSPKSAVIVEAYQPDQLQARIDVPLNEAAALTVGQDVELVSDLLPDRSFTGTVTRISGQADLQRNTLQAKVEIHDPDPRLRPDMLVRAKFFALGNDSNPSKRTSSRLAIFVPKEAIVDSSSAWIVTPEQTATKRTLTLGSETKDGHLRVLDGVLSGESVILPPHDKLNEGDRIIISTQG